MTGTRCRECNGSKKAIAKFEGMSIEIRCPNCKGTGVVRDPKACVKCRGKGTIGVDLGGIGAEASCQSCQGTGKEALPRSS